MIIIIFFSEKKVINMYNIIYMYFKIFVETDTFFQNYLMNRKFKSYFDYLKSVLKTLQNVFCNNPPWILAKTRYLRKSSNFLALEQLFCFGVFLFRFVLFFRNSSNEYDINRMWGHGNKPQSLMFQVYTSGFIMWLPLLLEETA